MAVPSWFDEYTYLQSKLNQLISAGQTQYSNVTQVKAAIEAAGMSVYQHFEKFSLAERTSPNTYFNTQEYLEAKAAQLNTAQGVTTWTADKVALEFQNAGFTNAYEHFSKYGWAEGVNPSNSFDVSSYLEAKAAETGKTVDEVKAAFAAAGLDPIAHYETYGKSEGITVTEVPADEQVTPDSSGSTGQTFTLTINQDNFVGNTGNDTFVAGAAQDGAGNLINTLQDVDSLDGGAGTDTLQATVADAGAAAAEIAPTLKNIENVEVRFVGTEANKLSLVGATGVQSITVANSTNAKGVVSNVGAVANLTVKNQNVAVEFKDNTATTLNFTFDTVGKSTKAADEVNVKAATGATAATFTLNNANVDLNTVDSIKTLTVAATGANRLDLTAAAGAVTTATVTGAGTVDLAAAFTALTKLDASANTGGVTATVDDKALTVTGGSGKDSITFSDTIAATAKVDLGAGDDTLTIADTKGITAGATLNGGDGVDTLAMDFDAYDAVTKFDAADLAKITGFEVLGITDVLANAATIDVSKIAGITSFQTAGVATGKAASVTNLGAATQVIMKGDLATNDGTLSIALKDASGSSDAVNLTLNHSGDLATDDVAVTTNIAGLANVETLNIKATATDTDTTSAFTKNVTYTVAVKAGDAAALKAVNISGDQKVSFASTAAMEKLTTIDASANTAGVTIDVSAAASDAAAITIKGSATGANTLTGSDNADVIIGGDGNDTIEGGLGADQLTGGAGNDIFTFAASSDSTLAKMDTITDFSANTFGQGTNGAADEKGANADAAKWTGDVIDVSAIIATAKDTDGETAITKLDVFVASNAADALTFIQNVGNAANNDGQTGFALDSSSGKLYLDFNSDGVVDSVIGLTGVTTITEAAFVIA